MELPSTRVVVVGLPGGGIGGGGTVMLEGGEGALVTGAGVEAGWIGKEEGGKGVTVMLLGSTGVEAGRIVKEGEGQSCC